METRLLGKTGLKLPVLSFGASSLGQEFRRVKIEEALESVRVALDCGLNFIDTSPFYGRGMSEVLLGIALRDVPRDSFTLCTKLGRYDLNHFDFSARRVAESVDVSLHRLKSWKKRFLHCAKFSRRARCASSASAVIRKNFFDSSATRRTWIACSATTNIRCKTRASPTRRFHI